MSQHTCIFLLELEHGRYYVGASSYPEKTVEELREGLGPAWTQIHRPSRIMDVVDHVMEQELDTYVRKWMLQYGVENVRGGRWSHVRLTDADRQQLCGEITKQRGCILC
jgi:predicted GIY-YIG superfamily endonuclease